MDDVRPCPPGFTLARTVLEAMEYLATGEVNLCSLDHDMGVCTECFLKGLGIGDMMTPETTYANWCPHALDGTKLVWWMIETGHWSNVRPAVHSMNPVGHRQMQSLIDEYFGCKAMGPLV